jgi:hypothetical protein
MDPKTFPEKFLRVSSFSGISVSQTFSMKEMAVVMKREVLGNMKNSARIFTVIKCHGTNDLA